MYGTVLGRASFPTLCAVCSRNSIVPLAIRSQQQVRTTFILKRRIPPRLAPIDGYPKKIKGNNFIYDFVDFTEIRKPENIDIILTEFIDGVGKKGDVVSVPPGKARHNFLLPKRAVYASPENLAQLANDMKEGKEEEMPYSSPTAAQTLKFLERRVIAITMSMDRPWTLDRWHVRIGFRYSGIFVPEDAITLPENPITGPNVELVEKKLFIVGLTINKTDHLKVRCYIHHWSADPSRHIPEEELDYRQVTEPLFPENAETLKNLPAVPLSGEDKKIMREKEEATKQPLWTILSRY